MSVFTHTNNGGENAQRLHRKLEEGFTVNGTMSTLKRAAEAQDGVWKAGAWLLFPRLLVQCSWDARATWMISTDILSIQPLLAYPAQSWFHLQSEGLRLQPARLPVEPKRFGDHLQSFPTSSTLRSSSPLRSSSEDDSWDTNSWSSGVTCLLRSSIKQHSEEVFQVRAASSSRPEGTSDSETGYQNSDSCQGSVMGSESQDGAEHRDSSSSQGTSAASTVPSDLEHKIEEKLRFLIFLTR